MARSGRQARAVAARFDHGPGRLPVAVVGNVELYGFVRLPPGDVSHGASRVLVRADGILRGAFRALLRELGLGPSLTAALERVRVHRLLEQRVLGFRCRRRQHARVGRIKRTAVAPRAARRCRALDLRGIESHEDAVLLAALHAAFVGDAIEAVGLEHVAQLVPGAGARVLNDALVGECIAQHLVGAQRITRRVEPCRVVHGQRRPLGGRRRLDHGAVPSAQRRVHRLLGQFGGHEGARVRHACVSRLEGPS